MSTRLILGSLVALALGVLAFVAGRYSAPVQDTHAVALADNYRPDPAKARQVLAKNGDDSVLSVCLMGSGDRGGFERVAFDNPEGCLVISPDELGGLVTVSLWAEQYFPGAWLC